MLMFQPLIKYAQFEGRARRAEFWYWVLFRCILSIFMFILGAIAGTEGAVGFSLLSLLVGLGLFLPSLAVNVRRLHDINRSGWWILMPSGVFLLGIMLLIASGGFSQLAELSKMGGAGPKNFNAVGASFGFLQSFLLWVGVPTMVASLVLFIFAVTPGTTGPNRFGPDPKGGSSTSSRGSLSDFDRPDHDEPEVYKEPYKPVFDFGPTSQSSAPMEPAPRAVMTPARAPTPPHGPSAARPVGTFGKRN